MTRRRKLMLGTTAVVLVAIGAAATAASHPSCNVLTANPIEPREPPPRGEPTEADGTADGTGAADGTGGGQ